MNTHSEEGVTGGMVWGLYFQQLGTLNNRVSDVVNYHCFNILKDLPLPLACSSMATYGGHSVHQMKDGSHVFDQS